MTLEEAIAEIKKLTAERGKLSYKKPTIVFGQGKYLDEAVRILERHQMTDIDKQTLAKCVRIVHESYAPYSYDVARDIAEEFGYTVEELLEPEPPKKPEWYENIPEQGVLCWYGKDARLITIAERTEDGYGILANGLGVRLSKLTPFTDEEIESFKRGPKSNTEYMKGYAAGQASRDEMVKKLVADNADLTQKHLELVADMQLLGAIKKECEPMQLLGEDK